MMTYDNGSDNISPPVITISQKEEQLVKDDIINALYMPLSATIVLKRKKEMFYVPLNFENGLTIDAIVDSGAYVSAIAQKELDRIKQQAPSNILKMDDLPNFQIKVANGQLEKPTATATPKFDNGDHIFAEQFVMMKNLTGPVIGLHFMRQHCGHDMFARHRKDIGMNTEFKVRLTPKDDKAVYTQSLPLPIHLEEYLIVEFALMHKNGIITVLPFSKYASPIFAQRKLNGKLRHFVDLRKINTLVADDNTNNNHPVSTLSDAAQHWAGKSLFCKLDCSQAYHCLQMADQRSVEMLAFNLASRNFAYKRLPQGLSRSVSAFSSFMREYLDPVVKADQCAQYVDDIGIAANNATDLTRKIRAVFQCIRIAGLKLTIEKCHFAVRQVEFLGSTFKRFLNKPRFPKSKKALQRYLGFVKYYRNYIPRMAEKPNPFYKLLKAEVPINITSELKETFDSVNRALSDACELALKQPIPGKQLVLMTNAGFRSAGYALMIEDNSDQKIQSKRKTDAPVAFGSKIFSPAQLKMSICSKEILAIYMAFLEFAHILREATKPTIVLTDNKSVTRFFQTKPIPPSLWNACDYVLQFNFKIAHIAGSVNTAADFFSRLELKVTESIRRKIREDVQTTPIEATTSSSDIADEEQFFFVQTDGQDETEQQIIKRKEQFREKAAQWVVNQEPPSMEPSIKEFTKIDGKTTSYSLHGIKANAQIRKEQDADLVLKNFKLKILGQPHGDVLLTTDRQFKHYKANEDRIIVKDGLLFRK